MIYCSLLDKIKLEMSIGDKKKKMEKIIKQ